MSLRLTAINCAPRPLAFTVAPEYDASYCMFPFTWRQLPGTVLDNSRFCEGHAQSRDSEVFASVFVIFTSPPQPAGGTCAFVGGRAKLCCGQQSTPSSRKTRRERARFSTPTGNSSALPHRRRSYLYSVFESLHAPKRNTSILKHESTRLAAPSRNIKCSCRSDPMPFFCV